MIKKNTQILIASKKLIKATQQAQDKIFNRCLKQLKIKKDDEPSSTITFDYLFNSTWSTKETLQRISYHQEASNGNRNSKGRSILPSTRR